MLTLKQIKIKNFLSHKDTTITFDRHSSLLIDGKSGSGKSSIVEALIWCLYGEARVPNKDLVKHGEEKASVEVSMFASPDGDKYYTITRSTTDKAKNSLSVFANINEEDIALDRNGLRDTQDWIEKELLHASYALFINSIAYPQDNIDNFVRQNAAKRKDLLLEIVNVTNFDIFYENAKKQLSKLGEDKIKCESDRLSSINQIDRQKLMVCDESEVEVMINECETSIGNEKKKIDDIASKKQSFGGNNEDIKKLENDIFNNKEKILEIERSVRPKRIEIDEIELIDIKALEDKVSKYDSIETEWKGLSSKIEQDYERTNKLNAIMSDRPQDRDYDSEISEINKRLIPLVKETGTCPSGDACPFIAPIQSQINYLSEQINEKIAKKAQLEKDKAIYADKIASIGPSLLTQEEKDRARSLKMELNEISGCKEKLATANTRLSILPSLKTACSEALVIREEMVRLLITQESELKDKKDLQNSNREVLERFNSEERVINNTISLLTTDRDSLTRKRVMSYEARKYIKELEDQMAGINVSIGILDNKIEVLTLAKEAFGSKGLKTVVIDYLIPRLEDKINEILAQLSDFRVRLDTQKSSSDGEGVIEGLFINIFNELGEQFDFSSYSGGERLKITVSISEALASLQKCGFRMFDELFIGLDEESTEHFAKVMNKLQEKFNQIICISHLRNIKDLFDNRIIINKVNGTSKVQE